MEARGTLSPLWRAARGATRKRVAVLAVVASAARVLVILGAFALARLSEREAVVLGLGASVFFFLQRMLVALSRIDVECDLHRASAEATLEGDVLDLPAAEPHVTVFDGVYHATEWLVSGAPNLVASAIGAVLAVAVLTVTFSGPVLGVGLIAIAGLLVGAAAVRRATQRLHRRSLTAYQQLADQITTVLEARVELVARAAEPVALARLRRASERYRAEAARAALGTAALGRVPVAMGIVLGVLTFALVTGTWRNPTRMALGEIALLVATLPSVVGVVSSLHELGPLGVRLRPFVDLLARPKRGDVGRAGTAPSLPADVRFDAVSFAYAEDRAPVLERTDLSWPGGLLVLRGPNGSGKSTALRLVLGLRAPSEGEVRVGGTPLSLLDPLALRRNVGYLPQRSHLGPPYATVREAMNLLGDVSDASIRAALADVDVLAVLEGRGVDPLDVAVGELSTGQRQRLALARLLAGGGEVLLLDEPDANLDASGVQRLGKLVAKLVASGKMVAVAAHGTELDASAGTTWDLRGITPSTGRPRRAPAPAASDDLPDPS